MPDLGSYVSVSGHVLAQMAILVQFGPGQDFLLEIKSYFTKFLHLLISGRFDMGMFKLLFVVKLGSKFKVSDFSLIGKPEARFLWQKNVNKDVPVY